MLKHIIMMNGYTASGKSTVANKIKNTSKNVLVLHTAVVRKNMSLSPNDNSINYKFKLDDPEFIKVSKLVYNKMLENVNANINNFEIIILDGTYNFKWQRIPVYNLADKLGVHLTVINCVCNDNNKIISRLNARKTNHHDPLSEASEYETYLSTVNLSEKVLLDNQIINKKYHIIVYDSSNYVIKQNNYNKCLQCENIIKKIIL